MKNDKTDAAFRKKLEDFSVAPPPHIFDGILGEMTALKRKKRRAAFAWISAAAVVLIAFMAGWYVNENTGTKVAPVVAEKQAFENNQQSKSQNINTEIPEIENQVNTEKSVINNEKNAKLFTQTGALQQHKTDNDESLNQIASSQIITNESENESRFLTNFSVPVQYLRSLHFTFPKFIPEVELQKTKSQTKNLQLNESDKFLVAENIQLSSAQKTEEKKWKLGVNVSPGYSSHQVSHSAAYERNMTYTGSNGNGNLGAGISFQYKTSKKLRVESGVYYAKNGQKSENSFQLLALSGNADYMYSAAPAEKSFLGNAVAVENGEIMMNSTAGVISMKNAPKGAEVSADFDSRNVAFSNTLIANGEFSQVFDFIEIPLFLRYSVIENKIGIDIMGGVNAGLIVGNNAFIENQYGLQNIGKTQDISTLNFSTTVGLGLNYALNKNLSLSVEPRINYYLKSINTNPDVNFRPYRVGVFTGVYYSF